MKGFVSPINYDATNTNVHSKIYHSKPDYKDVFPPRETFGVSFGEWRYSFDADITVNLTREQLHELRNKLDVVCTEYPLEEKAIKAGA